MYRKAKIFGDNPVQNIFRSAVELESNQSETQTLELTSNALSDLSGSHLVAITHREQGAWANNDEPEVRGMTIPNSDIFAEYEKRKKIESDETQESAVIAKRLGLEEIVQMMDKMVGFAVSAVAPNNSEKS
ncbi:MAG: hypothetical protein OXI60_00765 [Acidiferrobacterales bacterium]|nr:hypothetical protein [Acidiferrobacterales bacterium]